MAFSFETETRIAEAFVFAVHAHRNQTRKGTDGLPYATHPIRVAMLLKECSAPAECQIAGVLHDTVEDTDVTIAEIEERFGSQVASIVDALTKPAEGKLSPVQVEARLRSANALLVKAADLCVNMRDTAEFYRHGKDLSSVFRDPARSINGYLELSELISARINTLCEDTDLMHAFDLLTITLNRETDALRKVAETL